MRFQKLKSFWVAATVSIALMGVVYASARYVTNFSKIQLDQNAILDSNGTQRLSIGSTNAITGALTVSGALTTSGALTASGAFTVYSSTAPRDSGVGVTPPAAGSLIYNSTDKELCMSTGTTLSTWVRVSISSATQACLH
jgi:hypothetical protein